MCKSIEMNYSESMSIKQKLRETRILKWTEKYKFNVYLADSRQLQLLGSMLL